MQTKLGVSAGIVAAAAYFLGLFGGWVPIVLVTGYVLIVETTNDWLRMSVIKAAGIRILFAVIIAIIGFIPDLMNFVDSFVSIFNLNFHIALISKSVIFLNTGLIILEKILLLVLGFLALSQKTFGFGAIDKLIAKHMLKSQ